MEGFGGIRVKTYLQSKERATLAESQFLESHLERDEYTLRLPNKNDQYWLKERELSKEQQEMRFGLGFRTENQRIQNVIEKNQCMDHAQRNMKMVYHPDWKVPQKTKWVADQDFNNKTLLYQGPRAKEEALWQLVPINSGIHQPYEDGFDMLGQKLTMRNRIKSLEVRYRLGFRIAFCFKRALLK